MAVIVTVISAADGSIFQHSNKYVVAWDPHTEYGVLALTTSRNKKFAKRFADGGTALTEWNTISTKQPVRPDGKPNKPLTAVTIHLEYVDEQVKSA